MKKLFLTLALVNLFNLQSSFSQHYGTALGLRVGNSDSYRSLGLSLQQRIEKKVTLEGIIQTDFNVNHNLSILAEKHTSILSKRLNVYYGAGPSFGVEESFVKVPDSKEIIHTYGNKTVGLDFIGGVELDLAGLSISLDYKPNLNIAGREEFFKGQTGFTVRTILVSHRDQKRNQKRKTRAKNAKNNPPNRSFSDLFPKKN